MTDFHDIEGLKRGDERSYSSLVDTFSVLIYNLSLNLLENENDAQDITQEVFTTIYLSVDQFKGDSKLSTWIYRITINKCQELIRSRSRKKRFGFLMSIDKAQITQSQTSNFYHPGLELENKERGAILFSALNNLPENQKIAFMLHKIDGVPYDEIAKIMNLSLSSVESLIFRAKQNLKKFLGDYYDKNER